MQQTLEEAVKKIADASVIVVLVSAIVIK